jgi:DNA-binding NtrC family response regulator
LRVTESPPESRGASKRNKSGEQIMIEDALHRFQGDKTKAARFIGWNRQKLYRRIKIFAISSDFGKAA